MDISKSNSIDDIAIVSLIAESIVKNSSCNNARPCRCHNLKVRLIRLYLENSHYQTYFYLKFLFSCMLNVKLSNCERLSSRNLLSYAFCAVAKTARTVDRSITLSCQIQTVYKSRCCRFTELKCQSQLSSMRSTAKECLKLYSLCNILHTARIARPKVVLKADLCMLRVRLIFSSCDKKCTVRC